jgi:dolichol kinase
MHLLLAITAVFLLLIIGEILYRRSDTSEEFSRKFVHITVGSFVASWPFFLRWREILGLSLVFLIAVGLSKFLNIFNAIHSVQRPTWGEVCFALAVGVVAVMTRDKWIYMAALLQMSLADGLAAVIGTAYGRRNRYKFLGHTKSVVGTLTFIVVSTLILMAYSHYGHVELGVLLITLVALCAGLIENVGVRGVDNLLVPVFVAAVLAIR